MDVKSNNYIKNIDAIYDYLYNEKIEENMNPILTIYKKLNHNYLMFYYIFSGLNDLGLKRFGFETIC